MSNDFVAFAEENTGHSSTIVVVAADSCKQAGSEAYQTNSKKEGGQGRHHAAAAEDFRTGFATRDFVAVRIGCATADHTQAAVASAGFRTDLVDHPKVEVHNVVEEGLGGEEGLAGGRMDSVHMAEVVVGNADLNHLACEERTEESL